MNSFRFAAALCAALCFTLPAAAQVSVTDTWVRGTVAGQMATGEARSPVAGVVEIHEMKMENNVMRMRAIPALDLPAGKTVELKPGGYHVMLMDLKRQLKEGETVPVTLEIESDGQRIRLELPFAVRAPTARNDMMKKHGQ